MSSVLLSDAAFSILRQTTIPRCPGPYAVNVLVPSLKSLAQLISPLLLTPHSRAEDTISSSLPTGDVRVKVTNKPCAFWPGKCSKMSWALCGYGQHKFGSGL